MKSRMINLLGIAAALAGGCATNGDLSEVESNRPEYWPTDGWKKSTPEAQGMSSAALAQMMSALEEKGIVLDSLTVVRNGYLVADLYPNALFPADHEHVVNSCAKSVMSALIGIAIEQGHISGVDARVTDLLGVDLRDSEGRLAALTLQDLLTMRTGLRSRDSFLYEWEGLFAMMKTEDWVEYALSLPFDADPGRRFDYSNISSYLLSSILAKTTGTDTQSFAREYLFGPLGIELARWEEDPKGNAVGFARMWLKPRDMAKIGLLYLQKGRWEDRQIVPAAWVEESTQAHARPKRYVYFRKANGRPDYILSGGYWMFTNLARPFSEGYGYQWWIGKDGTYSAIGVNGQFIMVSPRHNLVVAATGKFFGKEAMLPAMLLEKRIIPAVVSDEALPDDPAAYAVLDKWSTPPDLDETRTAVVPLSDIAIGLGGVTFAATENPWDYDAFSFLFEGDVSSGWMSFEKAGEPARIEVGLDGIRRWTMVDGLRYASRGAWLDERTFEVEHEIIGYSAPTTWTFSFDGDGSAAIIEHSVIGDNEYTARAR